MALPEWEEERPEVVTGSVTYGYSFGCLDFGSRIQIG